MSAPRGGRTAAAPGPPDRYPGRASEVRKDRGPDSSSPRFIVPGRWQSLVTHLERLTQRTVWLCQGSRTYGLGLVDDEEGACGEPLLGNGSEPKDPSCSAIAAITKAAAPTR